MTTQNSGLGSCHGLSDGTTPHSILQLRQRLLRHCMEGLHLFSTLYIEEFICRGGQAAVDGLGWGCAIVEISPRSCLDKNDGTLWLGSKGSGFCNKGHGLSKDSAIPSLYFASPANQKLAAHFYGPFKILERIGVVAYHLELPEGVNIHPVFHVSKLKARVGTSNLLSPVLPYWDRRNEPTSEVDLGPLCTLQGPFGGGSFGALAGLARGRTPLGSQLRSLHHVFLMLNLEGKVP